MAGTPILKRLTSNVKLTKRGCWQWVGPTASKYPGIQINGKQTLARRAMWEAVMGEIPEGTSIFVVCGNKMCVNPIHMICGTWAEKARIMDRKRLISWVRKEPNGCWAWTGVTNKGGYGVSCFEGK